MTAGLINANVLNILYWKNPVKSAAYLVALNFCLWFLYRQRPICGVSIIVLLCYLRHLWKHRIRPEVLVDPPDHEDWVTLSTYDLEKSTLDFGQTVLKTWIGLRKEHYLMWLTLTSVFWIVIAKIASHVSFLTMLFVISNGGFVAGPLLRHYRFQIRHDENDDVAEHILTTSLADAAIDLQTSNNPSSSNNLLPEGDVAFEMDQTEVVHQSEEARGAVSEERRSRSRTPPEPESLTPYGAEIPSHEDSSEDEFMFDPKHFESSSSSASNSFELLHF